MVIEALPKISLIAEVPVSCFGFGYDAGSRDYKVVRLVEEDGPGTGMCEVQVYSLRANVWNNRIMKMVEEEMPGSKSRRLSCYVPKEGAIYWWLPMIVFSAVRKKKIVRYDIKEDQWSTLLMPLDYYKDGSQCTGGFVVVEDHPCLLVCNIVTNDIVFDFWIFGKDYSSGKQSPATWSLMLSIPWRTLCRDGQFTLRHLPVGFVRDGDKFLFTSGDRGWRFFWFDLNEKITYAACDNSHFTNEYYDPIICIETLVEMKLKWK